MKACASQQESNFDIEYCSISNGVAEKRCVAFTLAGFSDASGKVQRLVATGIDITERKVAERQIVDVLESGVQRTLGAG